MQRDVDVSEQMFALAVSVGALLSITPNGSGGMNRPPCKSVQSS